MPKWTQETELKLMFALLGYLPPGSVNWEEVTAKVGGDFTVSACRQHLGALRKLHAPNATVSDQPEGTKKKRAPVAKKTKVVVPTTEEEKEDDNNDDDEASAPKQKEEVKREASQETLVKNEDCDENAIEVKPEVKTGGKRARSTGNVAAKRQKRE